MNTEEIREDFPAISENQIYLDNAATTQKPKTVIKKIREVYSSETANIGRGIYKSANETTKRYEETRRTVANFIGSSKDEIVFVRNTTEAVNLVASSLDIDGKVVLPESEHHSNQLPYRQEGYEVDFIPVTDNYKIDLEAARQIIDEDTGLVAVSQVSNVFGFKNDLERLVDLAKENNSYVLVDAAQSAPRNGLDVKSMDADFYTFSGHKMLGPTGTGILYGKKKHLEKMSPYQTGGGMIQKVSRDEISYESAPHKFEAGTPNIAGFIGLKPAIEYLEKIGMKNIEKHEYELTNYLRNELRDVEGVRVLAPKDEDVSVVSFSCSFAHPHDVAEVLNQEGIAVRAGHHCAQTLMNSIGSNGTTRVSPYIYNTKKEIRETVEAIQKTREIFKH